MYICNKILHVLQTLQRYKFQPLFCHYKTDQLEQCGKCGGNHCNESVQLQNTNLTTSDYLESKYLLPKDTLKDIKSELIINRTEKYMSQLAKETILEYIGFRPTNNNLHDSSRPVKITVNQDRKLHKILAYKEIKSIKSKYVVVEPID